MNKREAQRVARYIARLDGVTIEGTRVYRVRGGASYELECRDTRADSTFVVRSMDDLAERTSAGALLKREAQ